MGIAGEKTESDYGCWGCLILSVILIGVLYVFMPAGYFSKSIRDFLGLDVNVTGSVYVTTKGGTGIKMAGVTVYAIDETQLRNYIAELKGKTPINEWTNISDSLEVELMNRSIPLMTHTAATQTDADGVFSFHHLAPNKYLLLASGNRQFGDTTEFYLWQSTLADSKTGGNYTIHLNNDRDFTASSELRSFADTVSPQEIYNMAFASLMKYYGW